MNNDKEEDNMESEPNENIPSEKDSNEQNPKFGIPINFSLSEEQRKVLYQSMQPIVDRANEIMAEVARNVDWSKVYPKSLDDYSRIAEEIKLPDSIVKKASDIKFAISSEMDQLVDELVSNAVKDQALVSLSEPADARKKRKEDEEFSFVLNLRNESKTLSEFLSNLKKNSFTWSDDVSHIHVNSNLAISTHKTRNSYVIEKSYWLFR